MPATTRRLFSATFADGETVSRRSEADYPFASRIASGRVRFHGSEQAARRTRGEVVRTEVSGPAPAAAPEDVRETDRKIAKGSVRSVRTRYGTDSPEYAVAVLAYADRYPADAAVAAEANRLRETVSPAEIPGDLLASAETAREDLSRERTVSRNLRLRRYSGRNAAATDALSVRRREYVAATLATLSASPAGRRLAGLLTAEDGLASRVSANRDAGDSRPELTARLAEIRREIRTALAPSSTSPAVPTGKDPAVPTLPATYRLSSSVSRRTVSGLATGEEIPAGTVLTVLGPPPVARTSARLLAAASSGEFFLLAEADLSPADLYSPAPLSADALAASLYAPNDSPFADFLRDLADRGTDALADYAEEDLAEFASVLASLRDTPRLAEDVFLRDAAAAIDGPGRRLYLPAADVPAGEDPRYVSYGNPAEGDRVYVRTIDREEAAEQPASNVGTVLAIYGPEEFSAAVAEYGYDEDGSDPEVVLRAEFFAAVRYAAAFSPPGVDVPGTFLLALSSLAPFDPETGTETGYSGVSPDPDADASYAAVYGSGTVPATPLPEPSAETVPADAAVLSAEDLPETLASLSLRAEDVAEIRRETLRETDGRIRVSLRDGRTVRAYNVDRDLPVRLSPASLRTDREADLSLAEAAAESGDPEERDAASGYLATLREDRDAAREETERAKTRETDLASYLAGERDRLAEAAVRAISAAHEEATNLLLATDLYGAIRTGVSGDVLAASTFAAVAPALARFREAANVAAVAERALFLEEDGADPVPYVPAETVFRTDPDPRPAEDVPPEEDRYGSASA